MTRSPCRVIKPVDAAWPPLQPWAAELLEQRIHRSERGDPYLSSLVKCLPSVPALMLGGTYPLQILETPGQITLLLEEQNHFRVVAVDGKHPEEPDPTYLGHSVGRWEGDTFVADTVGLVAETPLDRIGTPHSDALHLIERFRRTGLATLELRITIDDPKAYTRAWDARVIYRRQPASVQMMEYICDNNRELGDAAVEAPAATDR